MCVQNILGIYAKFMALDPEHRFDNTFWILLMWRQQQRLQTNQTHIGPTLHVGPNNTIIFKRTLKYLFKYTIMSADVI